jgi:hypothetical protein
MKNDVRSVALNSSWLGGLMLCLVILHGCAQTQFNSVSRESKISGTRSLAPSPILENCWPGKHFETVDFELASFIQFVNDKFVMYRMTELGEERLYCAYPVQNSHFIELAKKAGKPYSVYVSVTP